MLMIRKALKARGEDRDVVLVPDSAHGTNPATAAFAGFGMLLKNSDYKGSVSYDQVRQWADEARSFDPYGYREAYIHLIDRVKNLD